MHNKIKMTYFHTSLYPSLFLYLHTFSRFFYYSESSHNGIAAVLKTAARKGVGVRVPRSPLLLKIELYLYFLFFLFNLGEVQEWLSAKG